MVRVREVRRQCFAPSVMFFERNSTAPLTGSSERARLQQRVIDAVRNTMAADLTLRLTIIGSAAADEPFVLARERYAWAIRNLGVDLARISVKTENPPQPEELALLDEQRSVAFLLNDRPAVILATESATFATRMPASVSFAHIVTCDTTCRESVTATLDGKPLAVEGKGPAYRVTIDTSMIGENGAVLEIRSSVNAGEVASQDAQVRTLLASTEEKTVDVLTLDDRQGQDVQTLSFFDFNSSTPKMIDQIGLETVRRALRSGASVTLIASTDNIGTEESNRQLAQKRAQAVMALFGRSDRVTIRIDVTSDDANVSPMDRVFNRSVRALIVP